MSIVTTPNEIMIYNIVSQLDVRSLLNLCETNTSFKEYCDTDLVWRIITERDFPQIGPQTGQSWKELYFSTYNGIIEKVDYWINGNKQEQASPWFNYLKRQLSINIRDKSIARKILNIINIPEMEQMYNYFESKQQIYFHKEINIGKDTDGTYRIYLNYSPITIPQGMNYEDFFQKQTWKVSADRIHKILFQIAFQNIPVQVL